MPYRDWAHVPKRQRWLLTPPFEAWLAVAAMYAGLSYFLSFLPLAGNAQLVALKFPGVVPVWSVLYALGGLCILIGLLRRSPRMEGVGLNLLGSGVTVAFLAALAAGAPLLPTIVIQGGVAAACGVRLLALRAFP